MNNYTEFLNIEEIKNPIVKVKHNNVELYFLVDTGCNISYIDESIVDLLYTTPSQRIINNINFGNNTESQESKMLYMDIEVIKGINMKVEVLPMNIYNIYRTFKEGFNISVRGVLGTEFLMENNIALDFKSNNMYLVDTSAYQTKLDLEL